MKAKAKSNKGKRSAPIVARVLLAIGIVLVVSSLVDFAIELLPAEFSSRRWVLQTIETLVDGGIVPMVGIGLLFAHSWIETKSGLSPARRGPAGDVRLWSLGLSAALGLLFLILTPLHVNGVRLLQSEQIESIQQQATAAEGQLDAQVAQRSEAFRQLVANPQEFDRLIASGQLPPNQAEQLKQFRSNPASIEAQAAQAKENATQEIATRRDEALKQAKTRALQSGVRTGLSSLILAIGYLAVAGIGIQSRKS